LDITGEQIRILRHGGITIEEIESLVGAVEDFSFTAVGTSENGLVSPGQLKSHYAPKTPLLVFKKEEILRLPFTADAAWLFFDDSSHNIWLDKHGSQALEAVTKVLSACGNLQEATACLFETLHLLDDLNVNKIFAQLAPQEGLGAAINDRLQRASVA
jgi:L-threonylcarbamoyladenylate synthase